LLRKTRRKEDVLPARREKTASLEPRSVQRNVLTARQIDIRNIKKGKTEKKSWYRYVFSESPVGAAHRERTRGSKSYLPFLVR
jgi:hypothetical protein